MSTQQYHHNTHFASRSSGFQQFPRCTPEQANLLVAEWREAHPAAPVLLQGEAERHDVWARIQPASRILKEEKPYTGVIYHAAREV